MPDRVLRYKYVPVDESFEAPFDKKGSLSIIKDGTIKFTHRKNFNDPFDCLPEINTKAILESIRKTPRSSDEKKDMDRIIEKEKGKLSPRKMAIERAKLLRKNEINFEKNSYEIFDKYGICCLSRNPLNLLMWAHYATHHRGFVVEFFIPTINPFYTTENVPFNFTTKDLISYRNHNLVPSPVMYEKERPIMDGGNDDFNKKFLIKSKDWEYEQEERVIDDMREYGIYSYNRKILKSVIAGMRMSDDDFTVLKNIVDDVNKVHGMNVTVHKAEAVKGKFALTVPGRDDLNDAKY